MGDPAEAKARLYVACGIHDLIAKLRHDGCGGRAGRVELLTGIDGVSSRPVRKIVVRAG